MVSSNLQKLKNKIYGTSVSTINKTDRHDITEILLKVALNTIKQTKKQTKFIEIYSFG
jgi:uncharacterized protein YlxP (DUF503 family)